MAETKDNTGMILNFAFNYGSRKEIVTASQKLAQKVKDGKLKPEEITEEKFSQELLTADLAPYDNPDLLIRTSGEERLSNFLLWQLAYSEFEFTPKLWPDFNAEDLKELVEDFNKRDRRFGKV